MPPAAALAALNSAAPGLAAPYLEAAIDQGIATAEDFHTTLATIYVSALAEVQSGGSPASPRHHAAATSAGFSEAETTRKLLKIINDSPFVQLGELLRQVPEAPPRSLLLAIAALHERQHRYEAALQVYAHRLRDHAAAEAFADRLYDAMMVRPARSGRDAPASAGRACVQLRNRCQLVRALARDEGGRCGDGATPGGVLAGGG